MPSRLHETIVEMLRDKPELVVALLRAGGEELPEATRAVVVGESLASAVPDYRADCVVELRDERGVLDRVVVVEVQLQKSREKLFSLPVYQALVRARHRVPCEVLVIAPLPRVAEWLRRPVALGGGSVFRASVIGANDLPAGGGPELAFLRALGQKDPALVVDATTTFERLPVARAELYFDLILASLPKVTRAMVEALMESKPYEFKSSFMRRIKRECVEEGLREGRARGQAEGRAEGHAEGRAEGHAEGRAEGLRVAIRSVLASRGIPLTAEHAARLDAERDEARLLEWAARAAVVAEARALFEEAPG